MRLLPAVIVVAAITSTCTDVGTSSALAAPATGPVVLELFSSEGCSSCPPADAVLRKLAGASSGAEVIGLELHVDYWNDLGWADPFSSPAFTARQRAYADALGQRGVYTPELVVDGASQVVGSNEPAIRALIAAAAQARKATVQLTASGEKVAILVRDLPNPADTSDVWLAVTEDGLVTAVPRGENAGAKLAHGPVVRSLRRVGEIAPPSQGLRREVEIALQPEWARDRLKVVAFVAARPSMKIVGAATKALP